MKKRTKLITGIAIALLCMLLAGGAALAYVILNSPERILIKAVNTLATELTEAKKNQSEKPDIDMLLQIYTSGKFEADYNITAQDSFFDKDTTLNGSCEYDAIDQKMRSENEVALDAAGIAEMQLYIEKDKVYMLYPDWLKGSFITSLDQYGQSSDSFFAKPSTELADAAGLFEEADENTLKDIVCLAEGIKVEKVKGAEDVYRITVLKETAEKALDMDVTIQSDYVMDIRLLDNRYVAEITNVKTPLQVEELGNVTFTMSFGREQNRLDSVELAIETETVSLDYEYLYEDGNIDMRIDRSTKGVEQEISFLGKITGNENEISMDIDELCVRLNGKMMTTMNGLMTLKPLDDSIARPKTEPEYDVLQMTEEDYLELFTQIGDKIYELF